MIVQEFEIVAFDLGIPTGIFIAELSTFLQRQRKTNHEFGMYQNNVVVKNRNAADTVRIEEPDKNILVANLKPLPKGAPVKELGLTRFDFTRYEDRNFSALYEVAKNNIDEFINEGSFEDIIIIISIGMDGDLADEMFEKYKADFVHQNPIDSAPQIKLKMVTLNQLGTTVLTQFLQTLAQRQPDTRTVLHPYNEFQLKSSSEFGRKSPSTEPKRTPPQQPDTNDVDKWILYRLEMMPFGLKKLTLKKIAEKTNYSYDNVKQRDSRLCSELRKKFGLEDWDLSS